jgi:hypothetical protein
MEQNVHGAGVQERGVQDGYQIQIGDSSLQFETKTVNDPVVTGSQVLAVAGASPASEFLVFQVLQSGALEVVRPEQTVDLRHPGAEKFVLFRSDRTFRIS